MRKKMKKSSLKTFLRGQNEPVVAIGDWQSLKGTRWLIDVCPEVDAVDCFGLWQVDVLDDGTAITYCVD